MMRSLFGHWENLQTWLGIRENGSRRVGNSRGGNSTRVSASVELLEARSLLSATSVLSSLVAEPTYEVEKSVTASATNSSATGYTPSQIQTGYGFNLVSLSSGANGTGQTIAIVDAYNDPTIQSDLQAFDLAFGIANPPSLQVVNETGGSSLPGTDPTKGWEVEESLDVEWAHALAPGANIVLVEASSDSMLDLFTAVKTAADLPGVSVVSMSWGGNEFPGETAYDSYFTTPAGHQGVTFVASTGDDAEPGGYPAFSPDVLAVGGTTLDLSSSGTYVSEIGWADSGGGISNYESQPSYQTGIVTQTTTQRANPDVSFDADPDTGVPVYDSFSNGSGDPWEQVGGTSLSAPSWAAIISIVDQARVQEGLSSLDGATQTLPMLYKLDQTEPAAFHDITIGYNGYSAGPGYDLVTGLGSPVVNNLVAGLSGATSTSTSKLVYQQVPSSGTAGSALGTVTVVIDNQNGQIVTTDDSTVTLSLSSGPGHFASGSTVSVNAVNGVATFSNLLLDVAGSYQLSATDSGDTSATSSSITINAAQASKLSFQQVPTTGTAGKDLSSVTVAVEDQFGNIVTTNNSTVTISVATGPGSLSSASTTTATAVDGIATFNNLVLVTAGTYTLRASDSGLTSVTSSGIQLQSNSTSGLTLTAKVLSSNAVELTWTPVSQTFSYLIYYSTGANKYLLRSVRSNTTSVEVTHLIPGTTYQFQIEAMGVRGDVSSNWVTVNSASAAKSILLPTPPGAAKDNDDASGDWW